VGSREGTRQCAEAQGVIRRGVTVFGDALQITRPDPQHSTDEERFVTIGMSTRDRLVVVIHADRNDRVRIISARLANRLEKEIYEEE
jgi:uncharacterized DUF497 family protein